MGWHQAATCGRELEHDLHEQASCRHLSRVVIQQSIDIALVITCQGQKHRSPEGRALLAEVDGERVYPTFPEPLCDAWACDLWRPKDVGLPWPGNETTKPDSSLGLGGCWSNLQRMLLHYLRHLHHLPPTRSSAEHKGLDDDSLSQRGNGVDGQIHEEAC